MKAFWRFILLLLVVLPVSLAVAPFTEPGSRVLLGWADRYSPLELSYDSGTIAGQLQLSRLALDTQGLSLELEGIVAELAPGCLWRSVLCFRQLQVDRLDLQLLPSRETDVPAPHPQNNGELIVFPVQVETDALSIGSLRILWSGGEWRQGAARLQLRLQQSSIDIYRAVLSGPILVLRDEDSAKTPPTDRLELGEIDLPLELSVDELLLEQPSWDLYGSTHQLQQLSLRGHWVNTQLHVDRLAGEDSQWGTLSLDGDISFSGDWLLRLDSAIDLAQPPLWEGLHERRLLLVAEGSLASLALQLHSAGTPELALQAQLDVLNRKLPFEASAQLEWPSGARLGDMEGTPPALAQVAIAEPLKVLLRGNLESQQFDVHAAASGLGYQALDFSASGNHKQGRVLIRNLLLQDEAGISELRGSGELDLVDSLEVSLELSSSGFELPELSDFAFGRLQGGLRLAATVREESWQVAVDEVDLTGYVNDLPARARGYTGLGGGRLLARSDLQAELNGAQLLLRSSGEQGQPGHLELHVEDLGRWQPGSRGQLDLDGVVAADGGQLQVSGELREVVWQGLEVNQGTLNGSYRAQDFSLDLALRNVAWADIELDSLQLRAEGGQQAHTVRLTSIGDIQGELVVDGAMRGQQWVASLAATSLQTPHGSWRLPAPVALNWLSDTGVLSMSGHCWQHDNSSVCPGDLQLGAQSKGSLSAQGDMGFLAGLMPQGVELGGEILLQLDGAWSAGSGFTAQGTSQTREVVFTRHFGEGETARLGWDHGTTAIDYNQDGLKLDWELNREGRKVVGFNLLLPPEREAPLVGTAIFNDLQIGALEPLLPMFSNLKGNMSGKLQLAGTVDQPLAQGEVTLSGAHLAFVGNPTQLENLDLKLDVQGDRAQVSGTGLLGGGQIRLEGELNSQPDWRLALSVSGKRHTVFYPPSAELLVSQDLKITAGSGLLDIKGDLVIHEGLLHPEQLPEGSVAVSADVVEVDYAGNVIREELPFDIAMDVQVRVEDQFQVTSTLLNARLGGKLQVLQRRRRPLQLFGNLGIIGGEVRAYQQSLRIKRGNFSFSGRPENPTLDVRAQRDISGDNIIVGVQVRGSFEAMKFEVFSEPAMSQSEAMSYLVRGRGLDAGAGEEGTAVALSMASGVVNRSALVSELNRIPGVSNVAFGADGSADDTAATVSGYIGNRIYLSYGVGLYEPINVLTARLYLRTRLWLEVVSRLENSVDLYYSFDID